MPRAELAAVLAGVQQTAGPLTIWSDSAYVVLGASKGWGIKMTNNQDLWGAVRERLASHPGSVRVLQGQRTCHTSRRQERTGNLQAGFHERLC